MGYDTGTDGVPWTPQQYAAHPGALHVDQDNDTGPAGGTCDIFDVEPFAGTVDHIAAWVHRAWSCFTAGDRPGQRTPTVYSFSSNITPIANALNAAGITMGVNFALSKPMSAQVAQSILDAAGGPFPIVLVQYEFHTDHDISLASNTWLNKVSGNPQPPVAKPGTQAGWRWCSKCQGLFYGLQKAISRCPAGGMHDDSHSHDYTLGYIA